MCLCALRHAARSVGHIEVHRYYITRYSVCQRKKKNIRPKILWFIISKKWKELASFFSVLRLFVDTLKNPPAFRRRQKAAPFHKGAKLNTSLAQNAPLPSGKGAFFIRRKALLYFFPFGCAARRSSREIPMRRRSNTNDAYIRPGQAFP